MDQEYKKGTLFRVAKQMKRKNRDIVGGGCVKDENGKIVTDEGERMETWRRHFERISNEEFGWNRNLPEIDSQSNSNGVEDITLEEMKSAVKKMKSNKASGPTGVVADMIKAAGEFGLVWLQELFNQVLKEGRIPNDWSKSWMVSVYKGKGDALDCGSYRGIKLLEHVMKLFERIIEVRIRATVCIDSMQFGFMKGRGTTDAIFIVRQLQEKYLAKNRDLWMAFIDLEKAFDRVPRMVIWWALQRLGVEEWLVGVVKSMYENSMTRMKIEGRESEEFSVKVGVHQGSVLSHCCLL